MANLSLEDGEESPAHESTSTATVTTWIFIHWKTYNVQLDPPRLHAAVLRHGHLVEVFAHDEERTVRRAFHVLRPEQERRTVHPVQDICNIHSANISIEYILCMTILNT